MRAPWEEDRQATTVKRTKRHGDHFSKNARAANEIVGREQFATVSSCSRQVNLIVHGANSVRF